MPVYEYSCKDCGTEFEVLYTSFGAAEETEVDEVCPSCGSKEKERLVSQGDFILKGSGWAKDRYR